MATVPWQTARNTLRDWRENNVRRSDETLRLCQQLLPKCASKLGDEVWAIYEQGFVAALDCNHTALLSQYHKQLRERFGEDSVRVQRLKGMMLESQGVWERAETLYQELLEKDPTNSTIMKRQVAVLVAQRKHVEAIKKLNEYLETFQTDFEAWQELADLYLKEQDFTGASFCFEELILSNPYNHLFHQKYAEILYTQGGQANIILARKYFSKALSLNPENTRALYGLYLTALKTTNKGKGNGKDLASFASQQLLELYAGTPNEAIVKATLKAMADPSDKS